MKYLLIIAGTALAAGLLQAQPNIDVPPSSATRCVGSSVTFTVEASPGDPSDTLTYLWFFNGVATSVSDATYTIASIGEADAGGYAVQVFDNQGNDTFSPVATLTVNPLPTVTVNSPTICREASAMLTATTDASNPSYSWSPGGATTASISVSPSVTTTYTCVVTDGDTGCSASGSGTATVAPGPLVSVESGTICSGDSGVLIAMTDANSPTYLWSPGNQTTPSITVSPTSTTTYTVTVMDGVTGCIGSGSGTVTVNPNPAVTVNSTTICAGGSSTLTATTEASSPSYLWSPGGATTASITVAPGSTTTYTVTVTDGVTGCTGSGSGTVTVTLALSVSVNSRNICPEGSATLTATHNAASPTFLWSPGGEMTPSITVSPLSTTTYTVTVTDGPCSAQASGTVTVQSLTTATGPSSQTVNQGQPVTLTSTADGTGPFTYTWRKDDTLVQGPGGIASFIIASASIADAGTYQVEIEGACGIVTNIATLTVIIPPAITTEPADQAMECHGGDATFSIVAESTVPLIYQWYYNDDTLLKDQTNATLTVPNVVIADSGQYKVLVSNRAGTITSRNATLTVTDTIAPIIALIGPSSIQVECHGAFTDPGATATDSCAGDLTAQILTTGSVNLELPASYLLRYNVNDPTGNPAVEMTRTVNVIDTIKPVITLLGERSITIECHGDFTDPGVTANDICAGNLTGSVVVSGTVDPNVPGTYILHYNVTDPSANAAIEVTRTVDVVDTTAPSMACPLANLRVCTSSNSATVTFATPAATDACDNAPVVTADPASGSIFPLGDTTVTVVAADASGNRNACTFTVTVFQAVAPTLTVVGYSSGTFTLSFPSEDGCSYLVQYKDSLDDPAWTTFSTVAGDGTVKTVPDTTAPVSGRFYQVKVQ